MSTALFTPRSDQLADAAQHNPDNYLNAGYTIKSWLLTVDHKRIAILYLITVTLFFLVGGFFAVLIRLDLMTPAGDLFQSENYNKLFTMHGLIMIFFFLVPSIPAVLGNFLVPLMIGARDLAFPRLNLASWYIYTIGGLFTLVAAAFGGVDTGWTFYTPYSSTYANSNVILTALGVFITGFSSILTGMNFIVTIHKMRAPGLTWFRLPLFIWAHLCDQYYYGFGNARPGEYCAARGDRTVFQDWDLRPGVGRRSAAISAPILVLFTPSGVHHDFAVNGSNQ